jgi:hypothetical protein
MESGELPFNPLVEGSIPSHPTNLIRHLLYWMSYSSCFSNTVLILKTRFTSHRVRDVCRLH